MRRGIPAATELTEAAWQFYMCVEMAPFPGNGAAVTKLSLRMRETVSSRKERAADYPISSYLMLLSVSTVPGGCSMLP